jgi:hypothetical protein
MPTQLLETRDRAICRMLRTHPSELERMLERSRQTITKRMAENRLFGVEEVVKVASEKIADVAVRTRTVASILNQWFPEVVRYAHDVDVGRFGKYFICGMHIHAELAAHTAFEEFVRHILSDEAKFVLFVCRPHKEHVQLRRWLEEFQREKQHRTSSFAVLPCKLVELAPIQIIAEPWSNDPKFIQLSPDHLFVDEQNTKRAAQLAGALMDYGLSERACDAIDDEKIFKNLIRNLNNSFYDEPAAEQSNQTIPGSIRFFWRKQPCACSR